MKYSLQLIVAATTLSAAMGVAAQQAGDVMVRAGYGNITPHVTSGNMSAPSITGSKSDVGPANSVVGGVTYMYTNNVSFDLPLALPFKHKLYGAGALAGTGELGEVQALPATVFAQYRFGEPEGQVRPYAGLGLTYAYFFNESGSGALTAITNPGGPPTKIKVDSQWTYTAQVGLTVKVDKQWFVDLFYSVTPLKTKTSMSTGQTQDVTLDPVAYGLTLGYKF